MLWKCDTIVHGFYGFCFWWCDNSWISTVFLVVLVVWFWLVGCVCFFVENGWGWRVECLAVDDRICNDGRNVGGTCSLWTVLEWLWLCWLIQMVADGLWSVYACMAWVGRLSMVTCIYERPMFLVMNCSFWLHGLSIVFVLVLVVW